MSLPAGAPKGESVYPPEPLGGKRCSLPDAEQVKVSRVVRLKRRPEFLAVAASGRRWVAPAFVLQVAPRPGQEPTAATEAGIGFTASRRIGNAVARNRAKRRLREAIRVLMPRTATPRHDYVLVARSAILTCPFQKLIDDLAHAFIRVMTVRAQPSGPRRKGSPRRENAMPSASSS